MGVTITIMIVKSRPPAVLRSSGECLPVMGKRIYRANALATQAKQCALDGQTGLPFSIPNKLTN